MATDGRTEARGRMIAIASYTELMDATYPPHLLKATRDAFLLRLHQVPAECLAVIVEAIREADTDPGAVDCDTPPVSEEMDARNSRPLPY
jgi:hypothetical protein